jgi:hypothetical protein
MFYINHGSDNFTMIDCMLPIDDEKRTQEVIDDLVRLSKAKGITRFISTHRRGDAGNMDVLSL